MLLGNDEGHPLRIETALLPEPKVIEWNGQKIETLVSQFVALSRRAHPRGRPRLVRAGRRRNVWYFGEDVFNYEDGVVADTEGPGSPARTARPG